MIQKGPQTMSMEEYRDYIASNIKIIPSGCWEWQGTISGKGYGHGTRWDGCKWMHRNSHTIFKGEIGFYNVVRHICDNPPCLNPKHLIACSQSENLVDAVTKGRLIMAPIHRTGKKEVYDKVIALHTEGTHTVASIARQVGMSHRQTKRIIDGEFFHEPV